MVFGVIHTGACPPCTMRDMGNACRQQVPMYTHSQINRAHRSYMTEIADMTQDPLFSLMGASTSDRPRSHAETGVCVGLSKDGCLSCDAYCNLFMPGCFAKH